MNECVHLNPLHGGSSAEQALHTLAQTLRPLPALSCCGTASGWGWPQECPSCILTIYLWKEKLLVEEEGKGGGSMAPGPLKLPEEVQSSVLGGCSAPGPGPPFPLCSPRSMMMKHQISSIIVTPPKIIGHMLCQSQLMSPTGEQVTLMVISSLPGTKCRVAETKSEAQAGRQPRGWGREVSWNQCSCLPLYQSHG